MLDPANGFFPLQAAYQVAASDYMTYRALYESTSIPNALQKANTSQAKFYQSLGVKKQAEVKSQAEGV